jgi:AraC-like DNA-binding protein
MANPAMQLMFHRDVQRLLDDFCALLDIRIAFFSTEGSEILAGRRRAICRFCRLLRRELGREAACRRQDRIQLAQAARRLRLISYRCHAGLNEALMPVVANGRLLGFVMIGQFRTTGRLSARLKNEWRRARGNAQLAKAFQQVPFLPRRKLRHVLGLFKALVGLIIAERLVATRGDRVLEPLLSYLREHPGEHLTLADAASMVHRSPSTLAHLFKRKVGRSFRQVRIEARLARAEELLRGEGQLSVKEIAFRCGFDDPLYFSRVFRQRRGTPPSRWRRR